MVSPAIRADATGMRPACAAITALLFLFAMAGSGEEAPRPNILFLLADDLGYGDLGCYGSDVAQSPRLDQLAAQGTRFTQFYVSHCVCSPTRASAMTGQFPSRHRIFGHLSFLADNKKRHMPDWLSIDAPSLPRALQNAGYRTAMIGKWHLGGGSGRSFQISDLKNPTGDFSGRTEILVNHPDAPIVEKYGFHYARTTAGNGPTWKHLKLWPEPHEIYPYLDQSWVTFSSKAVVDDSIRFLKQHREENADAPFCLNAWFKDVHTPHAPTADMLAPFADSPEKERDHYAMVRYMDTQIGRLLDTLDELELANDTLVIFSSDNGAGKNRGGSNGPLRGWKHSLYEGGIRVPLVIRWPGGGVPAGRVDDQSVLNICDFTPTFCTLAGAKMPAGYESDGEDVSSALQGDSFTRSKRQFWHYPARSPGLAMRDGNWKLLMDLDGKNLELHNLQSDSAEENNLSQKKPELAASMKQQLLQWLDEMPTDPLEATE